MTTKFNEEKAKRQVDISSKIEEGGGVKERVRGILDKTIFAIDVAHHWNQPEIKGKDTASAEIQKLFIEVNTINGCIRPFTNEFANFLLVNALRCITNEQRLSLTKSLIARSGEKLLPQWIPVSERLPEWGRLVLLRTRYDDLEFGELGYPKIENEILPMWGIKHVSEWKDLNDFVYWLPESELLKLLPEEK